MAKTERVIPTHDKKSNLRPHTVKGWWQVWSGGICMALLDPDDVAPLVARTSNYTADRDTSPHKVTFGNGRVVSVRPDGSLDVGWESK
jgi:hypothetical protein